MTLVDFIEKNLYTADPLIQSICLGFLFLIIYDFYHLFFSSILTWFNK